MQTKFTVGTAVKRVRGPFSEYLPEGEVRYVIPIPEHMVQDPWAHDPIRVWLNGDVWSDIDKWELCVEEAPGKEPLNTVTGGGMKYDDGKPRMDLLLSGCPNALEQVSQILTFGAKKYAAHSWQTVPQGEDRYLAALLRHLTAHSKGEKNDPESGMSHLAHAACNALFILELEARKCTSDTEKVA